MVDFDLIIAAAAAGRHILLRNHSIVEHEFERIDDLDVATVLVPEERAEGCKAT